MIDAPIIDRVEQLAPPKFFKQAWIRLRSNRQSVVSAFLLLFIALLAVAGPSIMFAYNGSTYQSQNLAERLAPPSLLHPLGTDLLGRDLLSRLLFGCRLSLFVGLTATLFSLPLGIAYGVISGYVGGRTDNLMMRLVDVLASLPEIVFVAVLLALFSRSLFLLAATLASISWLSMARVVRGQVLSLKNEPFVETARCMGLPTPLILMRHILPNISGPIIVYATLTLPSVILSEAFLSFLGVGVPPPMSSLGVLAHEGAQAVAVKPLLMIAPAVLMAIILICLNNLGDGLRDALDPRSLDR